MTNALLLGIDWTWDPGFRGVLTVAVAVAILCGSVYLILATNTGARLGFLIALTGFCGWMTVLSAIWVMYGTGWKGEAPTWKVVDVVASDPGSGEVDSRIDVARSLPLPSDLPDPLDLRAADPKLQKEFPAEQRDPTLGDIVDADQAIHEKLNDQADPWRIIETSNKYTGETQASVSEFLGPDQENLFESAADYQVIQSFLTGGKPARTDDSILGRIKYKVYSIFQQRPADFYAAVQLQQVVPQVTKPGQAPPVPVRDPNQPIYTVVLKRVNGHMLRRHQMAVFVVMGVSTAILANMLHRRDKLAQANRAAAGAA